MATHVMPEAGIVSGTGQAFLSVDVDGRVTGCDASAAALLGCDAQEAIGRPLADAFTPGGELHVLFDGLRRRLEAGKGPLLGGRLIADPVARGGDSGPVELVISATRVGAAVAFGVLAHEPSPPQAAALRLQRFEAIIENAADAIVIADARHRIVEWNGAAERLFGHTREQAVGETILLIVPEPERANTVRMWEQAGAEAAVTVTEGRRVRRDGLLVDVLISRSVSAGLDGATLNWATYRDIGERKASERELAAQTSRLQALAAHQDTAEDSRPQRSAGLPRRDDKLVEQTLQIVRRQLSMDVAWLTEVTDEEVILRASSAGSARTFGMRVGDHIPRELSVCHRVLTGRSPRVVPDMAAEPGLADLALVADGTVGAYAGVPVRLPDGRLYGTLCGFSARPDTTLDARDEAFLSTLADLLALALDGHADDAAQRHAHAQLSAVKALLAAMRARDDYTGEHAEAVVDLSRRVARQLGLDGPEVEQVAQVALLHDLGKVGVPDSILRKRGPLDAQEWALMREHPAIGARIVTSIDAVSHLAPAIHAEHERWDGTGYPRRLSAQRIPIAARITFACDAYHAMISDRPYRRSIGHAAALAQLRENAGGQFDPTVVDALLRTLGEE